MLLSFILKKIYSCFDTGCPKKSVKRTRQRREVVWEIPNKFH